MSHILRQESTKQNPAILTDGLSDKVVVKLCTGKGAPALGVLQAAHKLKGTLKVLDVGDKNTNGLEVLLELLEDGEGFLMCVEHKLRYDSLVS